MSRSVSEYAFLSALGLQVAKIAAGQHISAADELMLPEGFESLQNVGRNWERLASLIKNNADAASVLREYEMFITTLNSSLSLTTNNDIKQASGTVIVSLERMDLDYEREMERLRRSGKEFCICLIRLDRTAYDLGIGREDIMERIMRVIFESMRSFDDIYLYNENYIIAFLKLTDQNGALRFLQRVQKGLKLQPEQANQAISVSGLIAQPVVGEKLNTLLEEMRADLDQVCARSAEEALMRKEASPLQKYLNQD
ncbi:MAG: hypothetical protein AB7E85_08460 [Pseudobdellovibrionaceae bacterium]